MGRYSGKTCRLIFMLVLTFSYFLVELIVGHVSNSLALVGDSYHMLSDVIALIVGLASVKISKLNSHKNTYGWARAEVLGALVNSVFLIALCFTVMIEAIQKLSTGENVVDADKIDLLLYVGIAGLAINVVGLIIFHQHSHGHSHGGGGHSHGKKGHSHENKGHSHESGETHENGGSSHDENGCKGKTADCKRPSSQSNHSHSNHNSSTAKASNGMTLVVQDSVLSTSSDRRARSEEESSPGDRDDYVVTRVVIGQNNEIGNSLNTLTEAKKASQSGAQLNMRGVFLHVLGDALGSVAVIVSALVIKFASGDWRYYVDPSLSLLMVIIISFTSIRLLKESAFILLQTVPTHIQVSKLKDRLVDQIKGVLAVHEFHVWQLAGNRIIASAHIRCQTPLEYMRIAEEVKNFFHDEGIHSTTIQPEFVEFEEIFPDRDCVLECGPDKTCFVDTCCARKKIPPKSSTNPETSEIRQRSVATTQISNGSVISTSDKNEPVTVPSISYEVNIETFASSTKF